MIFYLTLAAVLGLSSLVCLTQFVRGWRGEGRFGIDRLPPLSNGRKETPR